MGQNRGACYCAKMIPAAVATAHAQPMSVCTATGASGACPGNASESCGTGSGTLVIDTTKWTPLPPLPPAPHHHPPPPPPSPLLPLVPYPKTVTAVTDLGAARVPASLTIVAASALSAGVATLVADLALLNVSAHGARTQTTDDGLVGGAATNSAVAASTGATLTLQLSQSMAAEEYSLHQNGTTATTVITGGSSTGVWWGTRTLLQLYANGSGAATTAVSITTDHPIVARRSLMVDCAR